MEDERKARNSVLEFQRQQFEETKRKANEEENLHYAEMELKKKLALDEKRLNAEIEERKRQPEQMAEKDEAMFTSTFMQKC